MMRRLVWSPLLFLAAAAAADEDSLILQEWAPDVPQRIELRAQGGVLNDTEANASNLVNSATFAGDGEAAVEQTIGPDQKQQIHLTLTATDGVGVDGGLQNAANIAAVGGTRLRVEQREVGDGLEQEVQLRIAASAPTSRLEGAGEDGASRLSGGNLLNSASYLDNPDHGGVSYSLDQDLDGTLGLSQRVEAVVTANDGGEGGFGLSFQNSLNTFTAALEGEGGRFTVRQNAGEGTVQSIDLRVDADADDTPPAGSAEGIALSGQNIANFVSVTRTVER